MTGFGGNAWFTLAQNLVPSAMRARHFAIEGLMSFVCSPPSIANGGILVTFIGALGLQNSVEESRYSTDNGLFPEITTFVSRLLV